MKSKFGRRLMLLFLLMGVPFMILLYWLFTDMSFEEAEEEHWGLWKREWKEVGES